MFDKDMSVLQVGNGIRRLLTRREFQAKPNFEEYFEILTPKISCTFSGIMTMLNMQFTVRVRRWDNTDLKSSMVRVLTSVRVITFTSMRNLFSSL